MRLSTLVLGFLIASAALLAAPSGALAGGAAAAPPRSAPKHETPGAQEHAARRASNDARLSATAARPLPTASRGSASERAQPAREDNVIAAREKDGGIAIRGPGFVARFAPSGIGMADNGGPASRRLGYALRSVRSGGLSLFEGPADATPEIVDGAVHYARGGGVTEIYEARLGGIEQIFRIERPLPAGEGLRIAGAFATGLSAERMPGRGISFREPSAGKPKEIWTYGEPTLIDAAGRRVPGALRVEGDEVALEFSPEQMSGLLYPITIDPLLGTNFVISATSDNERECAIAWDSQRNQFIIVFEVEVTTGTDFDLRAWRVDADTGNRISSAFWVRNQAGVLEKNPAVAYSPDTDRWVIAFEYDDGDVAYLYCDDQTLFCR